MQLSNIVLIIIIVLVLYEPPELGLRQIATLHVGSKHFILDVHRNKINMLPEQGTVDNRTSQARHTMQIMLLLNGTPAQKLVVTTLSLHCER